MDIAKAKADTLAKRLNRVASNLAKQCNDAEIMEIQAADIEQYAEAKLPTLPTVESVDISLMMDDFAYVRSVLRENTECARAMLEKVSGTMLDEEDNVTPGMLTAFSELNKSITENMKLYVSSYRDLTAALSNINASSNSKSNITNNLNIINSSAEVASVKDIIDKLKRHHEQS